MSDPTERSPLLSAETNGHQQQRSDEINSAGSLNGKKTNGTYGSSNNETAGDDDNNDDGSTLERQTSVDEDRQRQFEGDAEQRKQLKYILPAVALGVWLSAADATIVVSSYGQIGSDLRELNKTQWISTAYFLTLTSFQPLYGKLSDIFGRKPMLLFAYTVFGLGCLGCGLAGSMDVLIVARALAGIGGGGMNTVVSILISDIVPLQDRGLWQGVINIIWSTGASMGAPLGGFLADSVGWRLAFLVQAPLCLVAIIGCYFALHLPATSATEEATTTRWPEKLRRIDFLGAFALVASVTLLLVGLDRGSNVSWTSTVTIATLAACAPLILGFVYIEARVAAEPFAPGRIIFGRDLIAAYLCNFFSMGGWYGVLFYLPLYFQGVDGLSATQSGVLLVPGSICAVIGSLSAGLIMRKTARYYWLTVCAYAVLTGAGVLLVLSTGHGDPESGARGTAAMLASTGMAGIMVALAVGALGNGTGVTTSLIALISNAAPVDQAITTACSYLFRSLGSVLGVAVASTVFQQQLRIKLRHAMRFEDPARVDEIVTCVRQSLACIDTLPSDTAQLVRDCYGEAIKMCFIAMAVITSGAFFSSLFIREKRLNK